MIPLPHQLAGARWLASKRRALLADEPRVGKTGAAIMAADLVLARRILIVTTASGRAVWRKAFRDWSSLPRTVRVFSVDPPHETDVVIVSWDAVAKGGFGGRFDLAILDEAHAIKNPAAKRTAAVYGVFDASELVDTGAAIKGCEWVWLLTGTPASHDPGDMFTHLRALVPERIGDLLSFDKFRDRYCVVRQKKISNWTRIPVVVAGRNLEELRERIGDFMLRRTQRDIGIQPPNYDFLPLIAPTKARCELESNTDRNKILAAIEAGDTKNLDMALGPLRRLTGVIKAEAIVDAVREELADNAEKLVLMFWHTEVGQKLFGAMPEFMPVLVDGSTSPKQRSEALRIFREDKYCRVFIGQIQACGEAVDLSAAATLWFVETCFTPALMGQAAQRIQNVNQKRSTFVKIAYIENSIDEAIQSALFRLWASIRQIIN